MYVDIENGKEILIGELTDEQKAKAIDILDGVIESQVGSSRTEKATPILRPDAMQRAEWRAGNATAKMKKDAVTMLGYLYAGKNQADIDSALNYFEGLNENISEIMRTPDAITLTIRDPKTKELTTSTIPMRSDGNVVAFDMFVKGATQLTQNEDVSSALKYIDKKKLKTDPTTGAYVFNADVKTSKARTYSKSSGDSYTQYSAHLNDKIKVGSTPESITSALTGTGYEMLGKKLYYNRELVGNRSYDLNNEQDIKDLKRQVRTKDAATRYLTANRLEGSQGGGKKEIYVGLDADGNPIYK